MHGPCAGAKPKLAVVSIRIIDCRTDPATQEKKFLPLFTLIYFDLVLIAFNWWRLSQANVA
ncbi:hypothetical protein SBV1_40013 [Verrucomicrobia bacterium]|nr:hypothetical protein SBV1_40013 [Verrucomicrobiota bacterium]